MKLSHTSKDTRQHGHKIQNTTTYLRFAVDCIIHYRNPTFERRLLTNVISYKLPAPAPCY